MCANVSQQSERANLVTADAGEEARTFCSERAWVASSSRNSLRIFKALQIPRLRPEGCPAADVAHQRHAGAIVGPSDAAFTDHVARWGTELDRTRRVIARAAHAMDHALRSRVRKDPAGTRARAEVVVALEAEPGDADSAPQEHRQLTLLGSLAQQYVDGAEHRGEHEPGPEPALAARYRPGGDRAHCAPVAAAVFVGAAVGAGRGAWRSRLNRRTSLTRFLATFSGSANAGIWLRPFWITS